MGGFGGFIKILQNLSSRSRMHDSWKTLVYTVINETSRIKKILKQIFPGRIVEQKRPKFF